MPHPPYFAPDSIGDIINLTGTNPGAAANFQINVPANEIWLLNSFGGKLTTDASVGNRAMTFLYQSSGGVPYWASSQKLNQAASLQVQYYFAAGGPESAAISNGRLQCTLPVGQYLLPTTQIIFAITSPLGADQLSAITICYHLWKQIA